MSFDVDIPSLRNHCNAAKADIRENSGGPPRGVREWEIEIPTRDGSVIPAWVYGPSHEVAANELPIFICFHGGGFCLGNRYDDFSSSRAIALRNNTLVASVDYR